MALAGTLKGFNKLLHNRHIQIVLGLPAERLENVSNWVGRVPRTLPWELVILAASQDLAGDRPTVDQITAKFPE